jgi:ABC-type dipeptide/oligopeptide/nickel transport system ATPase component
VTLASRRGTLRALRGLDLAVGHGETLGLVGESGCGKSMTARAILNILPAPLKLSRGRILLEPASGGAPVDLAALGTESEAMRAVRGGEIAMIFQEPMTSLSPVHTIGEPRSARSRCWRSWACPMRASATAPIPSTSAAACASEP